MKTAEQTNPPQHVLLLQGGGALGAYQAGAYEALSGLAEGKFWVIGVSIGAVNASLIAGNPPNRRIEHLRRFWECITDPRSPLLRMGAAVSSKVERQLGATGALLYGQPGFFRPWLPMEWAAETRLSFYDTGLLRETLLELVDFDLLNDGPVRLSVGAVQVATGNMVYFDSATTRIGPEHIMASGALPPGFPPVEIDGALYWDGGMVSNTPLAYFMDQHPRRDSLVFQVDLFPASGHVPANLDEVQERDKDIRYSSRTRMVTEEERQRHNIRRGLQAFLERLPEDLRDDPVAQRLHEFTCTSRIDVVHLIYRPHEPQGSQKDFQFDRGTYTARWAAGHNDANAAMEQGPWRAPAHENVGMRTFDIHTGQTKE
jgi:NTE family protein